MALAQGGTECRDFRRRRVEETGRLRTGSEGIDRAKRDGCLPEEEDWGLYMGDGRWAVGGRPGAILCRGGGLCLAASLHPRDSSNVCYLGRVTCAPTIPAQLLSLIPINHFVHSAQTCTCPSQSQRLSCLSLCK
jgi:hypothetical protein